MGLSTSFGLPPHHHPPVDTPTHWTPLPPKPPVLGHPDKDPQDQRTHPSHPTSPNPARVPDLIPIWGDVQPCTSSLCTCHVKMEFWGDVGAPITNISASILHDLHFHVLSFLSLSTITLRLYLCLSESSFVPFSLGSPFRVLAPLVLPLALLNRCSSLFLLFCVFSGGVFSFSTVFCQCCVNQVLNEGDVTCAYTWGPRETDVQHMLTNKYRHTFSELGALGPSTLSDHLRPHLDTPSSPSSLLLPHHHHASHRHWTYSFRLPMVWN